MIRLILRKELTEYRRDGRVLAIAGLISLLVVISLITGWSTHTEQQRQALQAQRADQATFLEQGEKAPHSAAHFGRIAYKPVPPLAMFDPGAAPYVGQAIWLEAHSQDPAMFRPAEDSPDLRRLADLSVAGVLTLLLPLLIFLVGYGSFAGERERETLRQIMSTGVSIKSLFGGKITAVAGVGAAASSAAILVSASLALMTPGGVSPRDTIIRGCCLALAYGLYSLAYAAVALLVSARTRSATSGLLILLSLWAISNVILPRVAAGLAEHVYPVPDAGVFWAETADALRAGRPGRDSEAYRAAGRQVLSRALGREVGADEAASLDLNRRGLRLEVSEMLGAKVYTDAYRSLYSTYGNQQRLRRLLSFLSPAIALQHLSSSLAGTDIWAHQHFAIEAERQRNVIVRKMNEEMMLNGAGQSFYYLASTNFWATIPDFSYRPPPVAFAIRSAIWDFSLLASWSALVFWLARRSAYRIRIV